MNFSLKDFTDFLKLPPNILFAISISTGLILFLPKKILNIMYLFNFKEKFGFIIGLVFLISSTILLVFLFSFLIKKIKNKLDIKKLNKARIKYLLEADENKVKIINEFLNDSTHTVSLLVNDGLTVELNYYGIISLAGQTQLVNVGYDNSIYAKYYLQPWVNQIIASNNELSKIYKL